MAYSWVQYPISVTTTGPFNVTFPYIHKFQVEVRKNGVLLVDTVGYTWPTTSTISLVANAVNGDLIEIRRNSLRKADGTIGRLIDFQNSAKITERDLDRDGDQGFYVSQEAFDSAATSIQAATDGTMDATGRRIKNVADPINPQDAATMAYGDAHWGGAAVTAAAASASAASTSATNSATSATNSANSATAAAASATAAATSATNSANSATAAAASAVAAAAAALPVGAVFSVPANAAPTGAVKMNGALLSRASFPALWAFAQASGNLVTEAVWTAGAYGSFSSGDLSTNFRLPDARGYFVRAWDDARGVDSARTIGSSQADANLAHNHTITDPGHIHEQSIATTPGGPSAPSGTAATGSALIDNYTSNNGTGITINNNGGTEARPKNIALLVCIKF